MEWRIFNFIFQKSNARYKAGAACRVMFLITALYARCSVRRLKAMKPETAHLKRSARYTSPDRSLLSQSFSALFKSTCPTKEERCLRELHVSTIYTVRGRDRSRVLRNSRRERFAILNKGREIYRTWIEKQYNDQWDFINPGFNFSYNYILYFSPPSLLFSYLPKSYSYIIQCSQ